MGQHDRVQRGLVRQVQARRAVRSFRVTAMFALLVISVASAGPSSGHAQQRDRDDRLARAIEASRVEKFEQADKLLTDLLREDGAPAEAWYWRGRARFCLGKVRESAQDFDKYYDAVPGIRSRQWERGIALYYARRFEDGAKQFELYQTYHDADVENATWRYLCESQTMGFEKARDRILKIGPDRRVPMRKIYELYAGNATVDDVFQTIKNAELNEAREQAALFYAHLYVGLWWESQGKDDKAKPHLKKAGTEFLNRDDLSIPINRYMGWVGHVHWELLDKADKEDKAPSIDQRR